MLLLYIGQQINGQWYVKFDNPFVFAAALIVVYESSKLTGRVGLNHNSYNDVLQLTVGSTCALYAVCFLSKKIEKTFIGKLLEICGRESFYIMGLHIISFHICTELLLRLGVINEGLARLMTPSLESNVILLFVYVFFGMVIPVLIINGIRIFKKKVILCFTRK